MKKLISTMVAVAIGVIATSRPARASITVSYDPSSSSVGVGDVFTVDVLADIPLGDAIIGFGFDTLFDVGILGHTALSDVTVGPGFIPAPPFGADGDLLAGILAFGFPPPLPVFGTDVLLATMTFEALAPGTTGLVGGITLGDPFEGFVKPGGGFADVAFVDGSVTVIPAPGGAVLALIGLPMVGWVKRKLRQVNPGSRCAH